SGQLNPIRVEDTRRSRAAWSIAGAASDFRDGDKVIDGEYLGWTPAVTTAGAGAKAGSAVASGYDGGQGLAISRELASAWAGHEPGEAVVGAALDLKFPNTVAKGAYRATLT